MSAQILNARSTRRIARSTDLDTGQAAVAAWYQERGRQLLACEPDVG